MQWTDKVQSQNVPMLCNWIDSQINQQADTNAPVLAAAYIAASLEQQQPSSNNNNPYFNHIAYHRD